MAHGEHGQLAFSLQENQCEVPPMPNFGLSRDDRCMMDNNTSRKANAVIFMLSEHGFLRYTIGLRLFCSSKHRFAGGHKQHGAAGR